MDASLYMEGSVYFYENLTNTKADYKNDQLNHDFIVSRPVYVLDTQPVPFNVHTINVLIITTSKNRVGIPVNLTGYRNAKILPYSIYSIHKEYLTKYLGQVSPELKDEVRQALNYHFHFSEKTEEPKYIKEYRIFSEKRDNFIKKITKKERSVVEVIETCVMCESYYMGLDAFMRYYLEHTHGKQYYRICDITKSIQKLQELYPFIEIVEENERRILKGVILEKDLRQGSIFHKLQRFHTISAIPEDSNEQIRLIKEMNRAELLKELDPNQKRLYDHMDIINKIEAKEDGFKEEDYKISDSYNYLLMKELIERDIKEKIDYIRKRLQNGDSPYNMTHLDQYVIYNMDDAELETIVRGKSIRKGAKEMKKSIKRQIGYLFRKKKIHY